MAVYLTQPHRTGPLLMKSAERNAAAMVYLFAMIPLWGLLFDLAIWLIYRQTNRKVVFHSQQAIVLHALLLLVFICFSFMLVLVNILRAVNPSIAELLAQINQYILIICGGAYLLSCCGAIAALLFFHNDDFAFPIIGQQLRNGKRAE